MFVTCVIVYLVIGIITSFLYYFISLKCDYHESKFGLGLVSFINGMLWIPLLSGYFMAYFFYFICYLACLGGKNDTK